METSPEKKESRAKKERKPVRKAVEDSLATHNPKMLAWFFALSALIAVTLVAVGMDSAAGPCLTALVGLAALSHMIVSFSTRTTTLEDSALLKGELDLARLDNIDLTRRLAVADSEISTHLREIEASGKDLQEAVRVQKEYLELIRHAQRIILVEGISLVALGQAMKTLSGRDFTDDPQDASRLNTIFQKTRWTAVKAAVYLLAQLQGDLLALTKHGTPDVFCDVVHKLVVRNDFPVEFAKYREETVMPFIKYAYKGVKKPIPFPGNAGNPEPPPLRLVTPVEDTDDGEDSDGETGENDQSPPSDDDLDN